MMMVDPLVARNFRRERSFAEEVQMLVERHGQRWGDDKTVKTVAKDPGAPSHPAEAGC